MRLLWTSRRTGGCAAQEAAAETGSAAVEVGPQSAGLENEDPSPNAKIIRGAVTVADKHLRLAFGCYLSILAVGR